MGTLSVRLDKGTEELLKGLMSSRRITQSDLIREMIEKEAAGGLAETMNSVSLAVDVIQDRLAELEEEVVKTRGVMVANEALLSRMLNEAAFSAYLWRLTQSKKTPEELAAVQAGFREYVEKLMVVEA